MATWTSAFVNRNTVRNTVTGLGAAMFVGSAACGNAEPLAQIEGSIQRNLHDGRPPAAEEPVETGTDEELELGVVWLRGTGDGRVHVEGARLADLDASLEATLRTDLFEPPSAHIGGNIQLYGPEHPIVTPERVGAGVVVAAPVGVLAELPPIVAWSDFAGGETAEALSLARLTHVSSTLVLHVRDAETDGLLLPDGQAVPEFQLIDGAGFAYQTRLGICFEEVVASYIDSEEVATCIAETTTARAGDIAAAEAAVAQCELDCGAAEDHHACVSACGIPNITADIGNVCLQSIAHPVARAACGEDHEGSLFAFLDPSAAVDVDAGGDDIRDVVAHSGFLYFSF